VGPEHYGAHGARRPCPCVLADSRTEAAVGSGAQTLPTAAYILYSRPLHSDFVSSICDVYELSLKLVGNLTNKQNHLGNPLLTLRDFRRTPSTVKDKIPFFYFAFGWLDSDFWLTLNSIDCQPMKFHDAHSHPTLLPLPLQRCS
jgi:hypothetical protein